MSFRLAGDIGKPDVLNALAEIARQRGVAASTRTKFSASPLSFPARMEMKRPATCASESFATTLPPKPPTPDGHRNAMIAVPKVVAFFGALAVAGLLLLLISRTDLGRAIRAVAKERQGARIVGIDVAGPESGNFKIADYKKLFRRARLAGRSEEHTSELQSH